MSKKNNLNEFSVALGLFDYINPIFYSLTSITLIKNLSQKMNVILFILLVVGTIISLIFGFAIPTVKLMVGLGKMKFKMPVNLVFYVNSGIFLSGISLLSYYLKINVPVFVLIVVVVLCVLGYILYQSKKFNTVAVLIGAIGYMMIYSILILIAIQKEYILSVILYAIAICLFIFLCLIGIKSNLLIAKVHWVIEGSNVICQFLVALSTVLLFCH